MSSQESVTVVLAAAAAAVPPIEKADQNKEQGFSYRSIDRVVAAVAPVLHSHGIVVTPRVLEMDRLQKPRGSRGVLWDHVILTVAYRFHGPAGDFVEAVVVAEGLDNADKAAAKAMTAAYKNALVQVLGIAGDMDPDAGNPHDEGPSPIRAPKPKPVKSPAELVRPLVGLYGAEHAAQVEAVLVWLNTLGDATAAAKREFVEKFGRPETVAPEVMDAVHEWVATLGEPQ